ncbi:MAG: KH domain-containing protein [Victivallaceae bacterium]|nr:KH domain-containing protein [Victivallaceae bacterium]
MLKALFSKLFGCGCAGSETAVGKGSSGSIRDLEDFVTYVVRSLVDYPDEVKLSTEENSEGCVIKITCRKEDIGKIVGKRGKTIMAIRSLVSGAAGRQHRRVSVEVLD